MGVLAKTTMIKDVSDVLENEYEKKTLSISFPTCFDDLKGNDASFELVSSNTMQPLRLVRAHNIVTKSIGVIFVHTRLNYQDYECNNPYEEAIERGKTYKKLFENVLKYNEVTTFVNLTKS